MAQFRWREEQGKGMGKWMGTTLRRDPAAASVLDSFENSGVPKERWEGGEKGKREGHGRGGDGEVDGTIQAEGRGGEGDGEVDGHNFTDRSSGRVCS